MGRCFSCVLADRFESTEGIKMGVHETFSGGEILFLILQFLIEITVNWNTFFGTRLKTKAVAVASWKLKLHAIVI